MKKKAFLAICFAFLIAGCSSSTSSTSTTPQDTKPDNDRGYTMEEVTEIKGSTASNCWWCGDYVKRQHGPSGTGDPIGTITRICSPNWSDTCAQSTTLGDGSRWALVGNCRCDG